MHRSHLLFVLLVTLLSGCTQLERVDVFVTDIEPMESTLLEQRLRVSLRFQNANDFDVEARGLDFRLEVNDIALVQGVSNEPIFVPSLGEAQTTVVTSTTLFAMLREALVMVNRESASYRIDARLHLLQPTKGTARLRRSGEIDLSEILPPMDLTEPSIAPPPA